VNYLTLQQQGFLVPGSSLHKQMGASERIAFFEPILFLEAERDSLAIISVALKIKLA
jgi:hypothetical protein